MPDDNMIPNSQDLDKAFAEFADSLLDGQIELENAEEALVEEGELRDLQEVAIRLRRAFGEEEPDPDMSQRIQARLAAEWKAQGYEPEKESIWSRLQEALFGQGGRQVRQRQGRALAFAIVALVPLAIALFLFSGGELEIGSGSAFNTSTPPPPTREPYPPPEGLFGGPENFGPGFGLNERVSLDINGQEVTDDSFSAVVSADGQFIAFQSWSDDLVAGDGNGERDIFLRNRQTGGVVRVSVGPGGLEADGYSQNPAVSADGRFVAFESAATNLVAASTGGLRHIYVHDSQAGVTELISVASDGTPGNGDSSTPAISADGRFIAFASQADNLAADGNGFEDIFVHDRQAGTTQLLSLTPAGQSGNGDSLSPAISADGRFVAFESVATDLVNDDTNGKSDIFVRDLSNNSSERASLQTGGGQQGDGDSFSPALSADGSLVAFHSQSVNLVNGDTNGKVDVFVFDRNTLQVERVSVASDGQQGDDHSGYAAISADGRFVAFSSFANNLTGGEFRGNLDIFVHDRQTGETERVSADADGQEPNGVSVNPAISADGRFVVFDSTAWDLVNDDNNGRVDVFLRDRIPPVALEVNYPNGAPGSFFTFTGSSFPPGATVNISVNGVALGTVSTDVDGNLVFLLTTANADPGAYFVSASIPDAIPVTAAFMLDASAASRSQDGSGPTFDVPPGSAMTHFAYMAVIER